MPVSRPTLTRALTLAASIFMTACGGSDAPDATGPALTATVSGVVSAASGTVIAGASVTIGSALATTGADGRFELQNLPVGSAAILTSAPGFETRSQAVNLNPGANASDIVLTPRTIYSYLKTVGYLPQGIAAYKAAIIFLPGLTDPSTGNPLDSRDLVRGIPGPACSIWCLDSDKKEVRERALALVGGTVALVGTTTLIDAPASYETLTQALAQFGTQSGHPEMASIPIFFIGHSQGGCTAYGFTRVFGARVAGFLTMKGGCHFTGAPEAAAGVPGHFLIGNMDEQYRRENITAVFEAGRATGAPWALSIDPFFHGPMLDFDLMFDWIDTVLAARLPLTPGAPLRAMTETDGWLGDRASGAISTYACYGSTHSNASWLPSESAALNWQRMAGGTVVVADC